MLTKFCKISYIFLLILTFLVIAHSAHAVTPDQISGLKLWLEPDFGLFTDIPKTLPATINGDSIAVWADRSGTGNDATQVTSARRPTLITSGTGGQPTLRFAGAANSNLTLGNPASLNFTTGGYTIFTVYRRTTDTGSHQAFIGKGVNLTRGFFLLFQNINYVWNFVQGRPANNDAQNNLFSYYYDPAGTNNGNGTQALFQNGGTPVIQRGISSLSGSASWFIGDNNGSSFPFYGDIQAVIIYNRALSDSERENVHAYLSSKYAIPLDPYVAVLEDPGAQIVYEGNSITSGVGAASTNDAFPNKVHDILSTPYRFYNFGVGGQTTAGMTTTAVNQDLLFSSSYVKNIVVGWEGTNDLIAGALTSTQAYTGLSSYYQARKTAGWKVVAVTVMPVPVGTSNASFEANRQGLNTLLRDNFSQYADVLVDMGNDPIMGTLGTSVPAYTDGLHPNSAGYAVIANQMAIAINALIHPLTTVSSIVVSSVTDTSAAIAWNTNENSSSMVDYGLTSSLGTSTTETDTATRVLNHSVNLTNLLPCTTYHFKAHSRQLDPNGIVKLTNNDALSTDQSFTTTGCLPPVLSAGSPSGDLVQGTTSTTLSLTTDENATCKYGTVANTGYASITNLFGTTGETGHTTLLTGLSAGTYIYYVRCVDASTNANVSDYIITFIIPAVPTDSPSGDRGGSRKVIQTPPLVNTDLTVINLPSATVAVAPLPGINLGGCASLTNDCPEFISQVAIPGCVSNIGTSSITGQSCANNPITIAIGPVFYSFGIITLRNGSTGEAVKELQRFLNKFLSQEVVLVVDGKFGLKTTAAVKQWQSENDLVVDGLVGPKTKTKMNR